MTSLKLYNLSKSSNLDGFHWPMDIDYVTFPGGEEHVTIPTYQSFPDSICIVLHANTAQVLIQYRQLMQTLVEHGTRQFNVFVPYVPGARGDRPSDEPFTGTAVTQYVDLLECIDGHINFYILDPHSDVTYARFTSYVKVLSPIDAIVSFNEEWDGFICPDAGAEKRTFAVAQAFNRPVAYCRKHRDTATGQLSGFEAPSGLKGRWLIVDDICDGGGTFLGLGSELIKQNPDLTGLDLYVTHGIFSNGALPKLTAIFNNVYTTNSWSADIKSDYLHVADVETVYGPLIIKDIKK